MRTTELSAHEQGIREPYSAHPQTKVRAVFPPSTPAHSGMQNELIPFPLATPDHSDTQNGLTPFPLATPDHSDTQNGLTPFPPSTPAHSGVQNELTPFPLAAPDHSGAPYYWSRPKRTFCESGRYTGFAIVPGYS